MGKGICFGGVTGVTYIDRYECHCRTVGMTFWAEGMLGKQRILAAGRGALAIFVLFIGATVANAADASQSWRTDARRVYFLEVVHHKMIVEEFNDENPTSGAMAYLITKINRNSENFDPGGGVIDATRFSRARVFSIILVCRDQNQTNTYYWDPLEFDNRRHITRSYSSDYYMCRNRAS